ELKGKDDIGVINFSPTELSLERALEERDDLSIYVVYCGREEQQRADDPPNVTDTRGPWRRSWHRILRAASDFREAGGHDFAGRMISRCSIVPHRLHECMLATTR